MFFARQKMFHGGWSPIKSAEDPRRSMAAKAGHRKYKDVLVIPPAAEKFTLRQLDDIMPGGNFYAIWREELAALNPKASLPQVSFSKTLPPP